MEILNQKNNTKEQKYHIYTYIWPHNLTYRSPLTLYSLQLSQCRVCVQSLGKHTRSLGANVVVRETDAGGWGGETTARQHGHLTSTPPYLLFYLLSYSSDLLVLIRFYIFRSPIEKLKNNRKTYKWTYNLTLINWHTLHSLQLSQCHVGAQSLGKRIRSLGANLVVRETGVGGWEGVSTSQEQYLYPIVPLIPSNIIFSRIYDFQFFF